MAVTTDYNSLKQKFNPIYWNSVDEFIEYYLKDFSEKREDTNYFTDKYGVVQTIKPVNHHPELKEYEVWMSGFAATGQSAEAHLVGKAKARNFAQACHILMCREKLEWIEKENDPNYKEYATPGRWDYNPRDFTYWGCSLHWDEKIARKPFG